MDKPIKSRRGVYYDLSASPYEFKSPYGDCFKFSSPKKLEIYTRDVGNEIERINKALARNKLDKLLPVEIIKLIERNVYKAFHGKIEG